MEIDKQLGHGSQEVPGEDLSVSSLQEIPGGEDPVVSGLSHTIRTLSVQPDPVLREEIGQLSTTDVSEFIGQFVQKLTTTPSTQIPPPLPSVTTTVTEVGTTPSTSDLGLRISNVMSLSKPSLSTPTPNLLTARKHTGGQGPPRIKPIYMGPVVTPANLTPPSEDEKFFREYIPSLLYQYNLAFKQDDTDEMVKIEGLLKAATKTLQQIVKWRDPPSVIVENIQHEDVKTHMEFVDNMREAVNNLRYAEPWIAADEDHQLCREYHDLLVGMIPRFESCSTSPNQEHVSKVQSALLFT